LCSELARERSLCEWLQIDVANVSNHLGERYFPKLEPEDTVAIKTPLAAADETPIVPEETVSESAETASTPVVEPAEAVADDDRGAENTTQSEPPVAPEPAPAPVVPETVSKPSSKSAVKPPPIPQQQPQSAKKGTEPKRGQKGKAKKIKEKYGDQDEEDRRLAMAALGHVTGDGTAKGGKGSSKRASEPANGAPPVDVPIELQTASSRTQLKCYFCGKTDHTVRCVCWRCGYESAFELVATGERVSGSCCCCSE
jgi:hypothetical protein